MTITISKDFRDLIFPLTPEELTLLEQSILAYGVRDPLVVWHNNKKKPILIDGHHRYAIIKKHKIAKYQITKLKFELKHEVVNWILENQLGRRNCTPEGISYLRGLRYKNEKQNHGGNRESSGKSCHLKTEERLAKTYKVSPKTIRNDEQYADAINTIITAYSSPAKQEEIKHRLLTRQLDIPKKDIIGLSTLPKKNIINVIEKGKEIGQEIDESEQVNRPHITNNSGDNEWYTPQSYIEAARTVMKTIDLDPASSVEANTVVKSKAFYTVKDDGLKHKWAGKVWMNPPYSSDLVGRFVDKLVLSVKNGNVTEAIVLVNNATETQWFANLFRISSLLCFPSGRVRYWQPNKKTLMPLQGQCVFYIGKNDKRFVKAFNDFGPIVQSVTIKK